MIHASANMEQPEWVSRGLVRPSGMVHARQPEQGPEGEVQRTMRRWFTVLVGT